MKIKSTIPDLVILESLFKESFGHSFINYGESVEIITENQGANYVAGQKPCAIDDRFETGIFYVRKSAEPTDQLQGGYSGRLSRKVQFTLAGYSKNPQMETNLAILVNQIPGIEYKGSNFDSKQISRTYFGIDENPFQIDVFTIDFSVVETLICMDC